MGWTNFIEYIPRVSTPYFTFKSSQIPTLVIQNNLVIGLEKSSDVTSINKYKIYLKLLNFSKMKNSFRIHYKYHPDVKLINIYHEANLNRCNSELFHGNWFITVLAKTHSDLSSFNIQKNSISLKYDATEYNTTLSFIIHSNTS